MLVTFQISYADIALAHWLECWPKTADSKYDVDGKHPKLKDHQKRTFAHPKVAEWRAKRPKTEWQNLGVEQTFNRHLNSTQITSITQNQLLRMQYKEMFFFSFQYEYKSCSPGHIYQKFIYVYLLKIFHLLNLSYQSMKLVLISIIFVLLNDDD